MLDIMGWQWVRHNQDKLMAGWHLGSWIYGSRGHDLTVLSYAISSETGEFCSSESILSKMLRSAMDKE
jgi:hypothetical protein